MSDNENQVNNVINELKKVQNVEDILSFMVKYMGNKKLRECINNLSDGAQFDFKPSEIGTGFKLPPGKKLPGKKGVVWTTRKFVANTSKLKANLIKHKIKELSVKGDGNCQFRSIAVLLGRGQGAWKSVKREMIKCLTDNIENMVGDEIRQEVDALSNAVFILENDGEWGDELTLAIARNCFDINIHIMML